MLDNGRGVEKDSAKALEWFIKAARSGQVAAQLNLGLIYQSGRGGEPDLVEAYKWFNLAASGGSDRAIQLKRELEQQLSSPQIQEAQSRSLSENTALVDRG
jgi:TPR repeat protein